MLGSHDSAVEPTLELIQRRLNEALRLPADERTRFLALLEAADPTLAARVRSLAARFDAITTDDPPQAPPRRPRDGHSITRGTPIGQFEVVRRIGVSGMGEVYLAQREAPRQAVAIKVLRHEVASDATLERFHLEQEILASLQPPDIARLFDAGTLADGRPYFVMEYVDGRPITEYCDRERLTITERLRLFCRVCAAVQDAHRHLVVHRDLKPDNILVTADGRPKLLDFGIAKLKTPSGEDARDLTQGALPPATAAYASPEQLLGEQVTTAADVYSLGVLLYELLCGRRPFRPDQLFARMADRVAPARLRDALEVAADRRNRGEVNAIAEARRCSPRHLVRALAGDLEAIVATTLKHEAAARYQSAEALAADVARHLDGHAVSVRNHDTRYLVGRHLARHRGPIAAATFVVLALGAGAAGTYVQWQRAERLRTEAERRDLAGRQLFDAVMDRLEGTGEPISGEAARAAAIGKAEQYLAEVRRSAGGNPAVLRDVAHGLTRLAGIQAREAETLEGATRNLDEAEQLYVWVLDRLPGDRVATFGLVSTHLTQANLLRERGDTSAAGQLARRADAVADAWLLAHPRDVDSARALRELQMRLTRARAAPGAARPVTPARPELRQRTAQVSTGNATVAPRPQPPDATGTWVRVPGGGFDMGCSSSGVDPDCVDDEFPKHRVRVAPFEMMRTEVTVGHYRAFARDTGLDVPPQPAWSLDDRHPIVGVPWPHAQAFCLAAGARLPTEAEWEFAARGGRGDLRYPWGRAWDPARANAGPAEGDRFRAAAPVASFPPSAFGLHDMAGNVWEWVADWYDASGYGPPRTGMYRVIRGGSFGSDAGFLRVSQRGTRLMNPSLDQVGFRCAR